MSNIQRLKARIAEGVAAGEDVHAFRLALLRLVKAEHDAREQAAATQRKHRFTARRQSKALTDACWRCGDPLNRRGQTAIIEKAGQHRTVHTECVWDDPLVNE